MVAICAALDEVPRLVGLPSKFLPFTQKYTDHSHFPSRSNLTFLRFAALRTCFPHLTTRRGEGDHTEFHGLPSPSCLIAILDSYEGLYSADSAKNSGAIRSTIASILAVGDILRTSAGLSIRSHCYQTGSITLLSIWPVQLSHSLLQGM